MNNTDTFIAFSDQHLGAKLYNIPELEKDNRELFSKVVETAIELKVKYLISVGDLFDDNEPTSELVDFVRAALDELKIAGVTPLAICGDHSKAVAGVTWEKICGFTPISQADAPFVGVNYQDDPEHVLSELNHQLNTRPENSVQFVFLHAQVPELWPFCDDKKKLSIKDIDFSKQCTSMQGVILGDIHIRREARCHSDSCEKPLFAGYCGSLGVTASDETDKPGLYYWDGSVLNLIEYTLPRKFIKLEVTDEFLQDVSEKDYAHYKNEPARPVFICLLHNGVKVEGRLHFLYNYGIVRMSRMKAQEDEGVEMVSIRSELKTTDRISGILKALCATTSDAALTYATLQKLLSSDDSKTVLDNLKTQLTNA